MARTCTEGCPAPLHTGRSHTGTPLHKASGLGGVGSYQGRGRCRAAVWVRWDSGPLGTSEPLLWEPLPCSWRGHGPPCPLLKGAKGSRTQPGVSLRPQLRGQARTHWISPSGHLELNQAASMATGLACPTRQERRGPWHCGEAGYSRLGLLCKSGCKVSHRLGLRERTLPQVKLISKATTWWHGDSFHLPCLMHLIKELHAITTTAIEWHF